MRLKDHQSFGEWKFFMLNPIDGSDLKIPIDAKVAQSLASLVQIVVAQMHEFDLITDGLYTAKAKEEADKKSISFPAYVSLLVEHQICIKSGNSSDLCWSNGIGDDIHTMFSKIDGIVTSLPAPIQGLIKKVIVKLTPSSSQTLGGCSACGGTKVYDPVVSNLGRAGKLNDLTK